MSQTIATPTKILIVEVNTLLRFSGYIL